MRPSLNPSPPWHMPSAETAVIQKIIHEAHKFAATMPMPCIFRMCPFVSDMFCDAHKTTLERELFMGMCMDVAEATDSMDSCSIYFI